MDRLTIRVDNGLYEIYFSVPDDPEGAYNITDLTSEHENILIKVAERLAAYEDTGLTPDEISTLCAQFEQAQAANAGYREALEYLAANRDGKFDCSECPASPCGGMESCHQEIAKKALASPGTELLEEVKRLRALFADIYPMIAGRVIQLKEAGEEKSAQQWLDICQRMIKAGDADE